MLLACYVIIKKKRFISIQTNSYLQQLILIKLTEKIFEKEDSNQESEVVYPQMYPLYQKGFAQQWVDELVL